MRVEEDAFEFGTKAETLALLNGRLEVGQFVAQLYFDLGSWRQDQDGVLNDIATQFPGGLLAVRSSAVSEDGVEASMAGVFESRTDVPSQNRDATRAAIEAVYSSYPLIRMDDQVLVQPMVQDVSISGVAMSRDIATGGPYLVINYDDFSGRTDSVTAGAQSKAMAVMRRRVEALRSERIAAVAKSVLELEAITGCDLLDVEFCITKQNELFILQVRRMAMERQWGKTDGRRVNAKLADVRRAIDMTMQPVDGLAGEKSVFGQMPDWNPAEMIGAAPKPLARSLYEQLVTNEAWAIARAEMGYMNLAGHPLMRSFAGRPFIDVRLSLNSMTPAVLSDRVRSALIDYQVDRLTKNLHLHDKVEFEIAVPSLDLEFDRQRQGLVDAGLSEKEIRGFRESLLQLTDGFVRGAAANFEALMKTVHGLDHRRSTFDQSGDAAAIQEMIRDCKISGVVPFAQFARHAFVAMSFLRSLVSTGLWTQAQSDRFLGSIRTVAHDFVHDLWAYGDGALAELSFLNRYGHLRPGTYDICSYRYDEAPDTYFAGTHAKPRPVDEFELNSADAARIDNLLKDAGFSFSSELLIAYMREAIELREYSKFVFTRTISDTLNAIVKWGDGLGIGREDLAFLEVDDLDALTRENAAAKVERAKDDYGITQLMKLPHVIVSSVDCDVVRIPIGQPTFITNDVVVAACVTVDSPNAEIDNRIVRIESADPGYDWIFSRQIAGLITKYGGANSHMAIRCAEFGIPAAIGCGERLFSEALSSNVAELNCAVKSLRFPQSK